MPDLERFFAYKTYKAFKEAISTRAPCHALKEELVCVYSDLEIAEYHIVELEARETELAMEIEDLEKEVAFLESQPMLDGPDM